MVAKGRLSVKKIIREIIQNKTLSKILIASIILIIFDILCHLCIKYFLIYTLIFLWITACWKLADWIYKLIDFIYEKSKEKIGG